MDQLLENLRAVVGRAHVLSERDELLVYECDGLTQHKHLPRAVVFPASTEEVSGVVRELARSNVSFAPRGAGTGLSGGALAVGGGVVIELARMRRLLKLDAENRLAVVETGMVNSQVSRAASAAGLYYAPDPSSGHACTVGGNVAENAGGIHCLKYGVTNDHVLAARVVLSDGAVVDLGGAGEVAGYDLRGVFVGSEGTFGIATEVTVRLIPLPQSVRTLLADFADVDEASRAVSAIIAAGLVPAALEMVDGATIRAVEASVFAAGLPPDAGAALLIELDGLEAGLDEEAARAESICREHGARGVRRAADERERKKLWAARKNAFGAMGRLAPDMMIQDAVVPRSRLPEILAETYRISAEFNLRLANVFHAGDGNLHPFISFDRRDREELRRVEEAGRAIMGACVRAGGTITGEHGVGLDKRAYLPLIFSDDDLDAMLRVRAAFDPSGLCNPGKIIPSPPGCGEARSVAGATRGPRDGDAGKVISLSEQTALTANSPDTLAPVTAPVVRQPTRSHATRRPDPDQLARLFGGVVGDEHVQTRDERLAVFPSSTAEACEVLKIAASEGVEVFPSGGDCWPDVAGAHGAAGVTVSTRRLNAITEHSPADLVVTAGAGVTLSNLNEELRGAAQWLPLDPPDDGRATLGGVVAAGAGGAQSAAYGPPRAHVLGLRAVLADGRAIRAGGRVVKNVAGYDLCKLFAGSRGTLCLLTELTFKLRPLPEREATLVLRDDDAANLFAAARRLLGERNLLPAAVEILSARAASLLELGGARVRPALLVRFAGTAPAVEWQSGQACAVLSRGASSDAVKMIADDSSLWRGIASLSFRSGHELRWLASIAPSRLSELISLLDGRNGADGSVVWHAGAAAGRLRVLVEEIGDARRAAAELVETRNVANLCGGSLVVEKMTRAISSELSALGSDAWGVGAGALKLMRRVKDSLDPAGLLSPGTFGL